MNQQPFTRALVTGSTGFIGQNLVKSLTQRGCQVTCLVRPSSRRDRSDLLFPRMVVGDVTDLGSVRRAVADADVVYHLAGITKANNKNDFRAVNELGVRNVAQAIAERESGSIKLVLVSSLAAAGPSLATRPRVETDAPSPVSEYGRSKLAGEQVAREFAGRVPTTIVRPPIVLGEGDHDGFAMFEAIARLRVHAIPGFADDRMSLIDAKDLAVALILAAEKGSILSDSAVDKSIGIYYAAADEAPSYAELGRMIGHALGRDRILLARIPKPAVWAVAATSDVAGRLRQRPNILNLDKAREATAGSWTCSADRLRADTGFRPAAAMETRLAQAVAWYAEHGWLKPKHAARAKSSAEKRSTIPNSG